MDKIFTLKEILTITGTITGIFTAIFTGVYALIVASEYAKKPRPSLEGFVKKTFKGQTSYFLKVSVSGYRFLFIKFKADKDAKDCRGMLKCSNVLPNTLNLNWNGTHGKTTVSIEPDEYELVGLFYRDKNANEVSPFADSIGELPPAKLALEGGITISVKSTNAGTVTIRRKISDIIKESVEVKDA